MVLKDKGVQRHEGASKVFLLAIVANAFYLTIVCFDLGFCHLCSCLGFISNMVASRCSTFAPERLIGIF